METLTRKLIESHLMSFIDVTSDIQRDGVTRYAWCLSPMAGTAGALFIERSDSFEYRSREAAINYAFGWIRRNLPDLVLAARQEAKDGIRYRATRAA